MKEIKENINPVSIYGIIGRKWYFIIGAAIGILNGVLTPLLCPDIFSGILEAIKHNDSSSIYAIFNNGLIPDGQMYTFLFLLLACLFISFINNTKRIYDISVKKNLSIILSVCILFIAISLYFLNFNSFMYMLVYSVNMVAGLILIFKEGKYTKPKEAAVDAIKRSEMVDTKKSVSFWRRYFAHLIDSFIVLNIILLLILILGSGLWYKAGASGIMVSLILYFFYYGFMNSKLFKGQTIGKNVLGIKVVDAEGELLSLDKSLIRSLIYTLCACLSISLFYAASTVMPDYLTLRPDFIYTLTIFTTLTFGLYLTFIFNVKTRQTFHDFAAGSYVVLKSNYSKLYNPQSSKTPVIFASVIALIFCWTAAAFVIKNSDFLPFNPVFTNQLHNDLKIEALSTAYDTKKGSLFIVIRTKNTKDKMLAQKVYTYIEQNYPHFNKVRKIVITLRESYIVGALGEIKNQNYTVK